MNGLLSKLCWYLRRIAFSWYIQQKFFSGAAPAKQTAARKTSIVGWGCGGVAFLMLTLNYACLLCNGHPKKEQHFYVHSYPTIHCDRLLNWKSGFQIDGNHPDVLHTRHAAAARSWSCWSERRWYFFGKQLLDIWMRIVLSRFTAVLQLISYENSFG